MLKPKVALVQDGFLPPGSENKKGRLSGAAIERCKELAAQGVKIEGYEVSSSSTVEKVKADPNAVVEIPEAFHDETALRAFTSEGEIGMRTVCNNSGASITYCPCGQHRVWVDFDREGVVYFKPRKE